MIKAYSYIRFSTPAQRQGDSLRRQLARAERYASLHSLDLDTTHRDLGLSGFKGFNRIKGALGAFLTKVEVGEIESGSYLLVENLDRLTRENVLTAAALFLQIIDAGIVVVTLSDELAFSRESILKNPQELVISIAQFVRGNGESTRKSEVLGGTWEGKRERLNERKLTSVGPSWLCLAGQTPQERLAAPWELIPDRVEVVLRIVTMCIEGLGKETIARRLNDDGVPAPKKGDGWHPSTIGFLLHDRRLLGEFQPHTKVGGLGRRPIGPVIHNYYPAIVSETDFYRAQAALAKRKTGGGTRTGSFPNLFVGLAKCECGGSMEYRNKGYQKGIYLICSRAHRNRCSNMVRFTYRPLEAAVLDWVSDVRIDDATANAATVAAFKLAGKKAQADDLKRRVAKLLDGYERQSDVGLADDLMNMARTRRAELRTVEFEIEALTVETTKHKRYPLHDRRAAVKKLRESLGRMKGRELHDARAKLSSSLREVVNVVYCRSDGEAHVVLAGGFKAYGFRNGKLTGHYDDTRNLKSETRRVSRKKEYLSALED